MPPERNSWWHGVQIIDNYCNQLTISECMKKLKTLCCAVSTKYNEYRNRTWGKYTKPI